MTYLEQRILDMKNYIQELKDELKDIWDDPDHSTAENEQLKLEISHCELELQELIRENAENLTKEIPQHYDWYNPNKAMLNGAVDVLNLPADFINFVMMPWTVENVQNFKEYARWLLTKCGKTNAKWMSDTEMKVARHLYMRAVALEDMIKQSTISSAATDECILKD